MKNKELDLDILMDIFNKIAIEEGFKMVNQIDARNYFSSKKKFFKLIDKLIECYIETEEYEKCATLVEVKEKNGWKRKTSKKNAK